MDMAQQGLATQMAREVAPAIRIGTLSEETKQMFDSVARRAFEIFESNGRSFGHDVENWLQAERELFHPAHLEVSESAAGFTVRTEVPGFNAKELDLTIDGRRLTISGKRETHEERKEQKTICSDHCSDQVLRVVDLPVDVNVDGTKATLKDGVLELEIPKALAAMKIPIAPKAA
jgi:HSP20 family molecular chaperone IbpA